MIFPIKASYMSIHHSIIGVLLIRHTKSAFLLKAYAVVADATRVTLCLQKATLISFLRW